MGKKTYHRVGSYTRKVNGKRQKVSGYKRHNPRTKKQLSKRVSDREVVKKLETMSEEQLKADQSKKSKIVDKHPSVRWLEDPSRHDVKGIDDGSRVKSKYFTPQMKGGWKKTQSASYRRKKLLSDTDKRKSIDKRRKEAAKNAQIIANRTADKQTKKKALQDKKYFEKLLD